MVVVKSEPVARPVIREAAVRERPGETARAERLLRVGPPPERAVEKQAGGVDLTEALQQANLATEAVKVGLRFQFHESSDRMLVKVIDVEKNKVIKEIPPEKLLDLVGQIREMIGVLLDEKR